MVYVCYIVLHTTSTRMNVRSLLWSYGVNAW